MLSRLSIVLEQVTGCPSYHVLLLDGEDQIGMEDGPKQMLIDFSDEQLIENCELDPATAAQLQQHEQSIKTWLTSQGWTPVRG